MKYDDSYQWMESRTGQKCSLLARNVCHVLGRAGRGIYNAPISYRKTDWTDEYRVSVLWGRELCNWDSDSLTQLWAWCSELMLRVEIEPCNFNYLNLIFYQRHARDGGMGERLPNPSKMLEWVGLPISAE